MGAAGDWDGAGAMSEEALGGCEEGGGGTDDDDGAAVFDGGGAAELACVEDLVLFALLDARCRGMVEDVVEGDGLMEAGGVAGSVGVTVAVAVAVAIDVAFAGAV